MNASFLYAPIFSAIDAYHFSSQNKFVFKGNWKKETVRSV